MTAKNEFTAAMPERIFATSENHEDEWASAPSEYWKEQVEYVRADLVRRADLRDHFAGLAMSAILGKAYVQLSAAAKEAGMRERDFLVKAAYEAADAMLAERAK